MVGELGKTLLGSRQFADQELAFGPLQLQREYEVGRNSQASSANNAAPATR